MKSHTLSDSINDFLLFRISTCYCALNIRHVDFVSNELIENSHVTKITGLNNEKSKDSRYIYLSIHDKSYHLSVDEIKAYVKEKNTFSIQKNVPQQLKKISDEFLKFDNINFYIVNLDKLSIIN